MLKSVGLRMRTCVLLSTFAVVTALSFGAAHSAGPEQDFRRARRELAAHQALTEHNRALFTAFLDSFYGKKEFRMAMEKYVSADHYTQHHPGLPDGRDAAIRTYEPIFRDPNTRIEVQQVLVDGDLAVVHMIGHRSPTDPGSRVINIFRFENDKIVEHWDSTEPLPATAAATADMNNFSAPGTACNRACLYDYLDRYLAALVSHDPRSAPLAPDARYTENDVALRVGDGLWGTISARAAFDFRFADVSAGTVGFYGVVEESGTRSPMGLRLTLRNGLIAEIESIVVRPQDSGVPFTSADLTTKEMMNEMLPESARMPRTDLLEVARGYFDTLQQNDGTLHVSFAPECNRRENGFQTTNNPAAAEKYHFASMGMSCEAQMKTGWFRYDTRLRGRRVLAVDEERGLVMMAATIDHEGRIAEYALSDGKIVQSPVRRPHSYHMLETFKIREGRVQQIEAVFTMVPYRLPSPWGGLGFYYE
jgi:predicted SnoaL-like aldol condensation-catalyzing enzyme